ncbi:hypothetical protein L7F22_028264 [Adiantum nelumboides]|nr:hypothetical protein [Adiantum nelumboides]
MTADHLVDGALLSPLREFVCEPSKMMGMSVLEVMNGKSALQHVTEKMKMSSCYQHEKTSNGMGWKISGKVSSLSTDAQVDKAGSSSRNARHARSAELERFKKCEIKHYQEQDTSVSSLVSSVHVGEEQNHGTFINEKLQQGLKVNGKGATHVKQLKSGNLEEGSRAPFLIKENRQSKKWLKKHEKACAQHVDKASHLIPCSSGKEKKKLLQDDAMVIPNMRSSPPLEMSVSPPACSELPTPSVYARTIRVIQQEWVSCDNCEKWRLLPPGLGSAELPAKWTCKSLYWLYVNCSRPLLLKSFIFKGKQSC